MFNFLYKNKTYKSNNFFLPSSLDPLEKVFFKNINNPLSDKFFLLSCLESFNRVNIHKIGSIKTIFYEDNFCIKIIFRLCDLILVWHYIEKFLIRYFLIIYKQFPFEILEFTFNSEKFCLFDENSFFSLRTVFFDVILNKSNFLEKHTVLLTFNEKNLNKYPYIDLKDSFYIMQGETFYIEDRFSIANENWLIEEKRREDFLQGLIRESEDE